MSDQKTKPTKASVEKFLNKTPDEKMKQESFAILEIIKKITKKKPVMWGSIVGFGTYHYKYASGREGDWPITGFSPRKNALTIYIMPGFDNYKPLMKKLGKYKTSVSCLYIKTLDDIHLPTLKKLITQSFKEMLKNYG